MSGKKNRIFLLCLLCVLTLLCGCSKKGKADAPAYYGSFESLEGKRIGVVTGTYYDQLAMECIKNCEICYYNKSTDLVRALDDGKIDAYIGEEPIMRRFTAIYDNQQISLSLGKDCFGFIFPKDDEHELLCTQMNEFLAKIRADGTYEELNDIWFGKDAGKMAVDMASLTGENGRLTIALNSSCGEPFMYLKDGRYTGYEVDIICRFCKEYGYAVDFRDTDFSGVLGLVTSGKADIGADAISITEERKASMLFSDPHYDGGVVVVSGKAPEAGLDGTDKKGVFASINNIKADIFSSFEKTFITENRWILFAKGIGVTLLITVLSAACGTLLGFLSYMVCRRKYKIFNTFIDLLTGINEKTPVIVILMVLFYIIFGRSSINGIWISVIGFSVMFACSFVGIIRVGVMAVDDGQREAALAMGFTDTHCFFKIIFPQAAKHFLPGYKSQIIALLKDTAIVGYIAVQDLTKVGDIIRSRTYEAFFPLIATAVIYFALAWILTKLIKGIDIGKIRLKSNKKAGRKENEV